ncbi:hypothetical protein DRQ09_07980, partial [candidate division KSB1 bacterium]
KTTPAADSILTPERAIKRRRISDIKISPDGKYVSMVLSEPVKGTKHTSNIWIFNVKTGEVRQLTTSKKSDRHPRWSPDSKKLAFLSNRDEKTQIYLIPIDGGEAQALTNSKTGITSFEWSPDGTKIAFLSTTPKTEEEEKKQKEKDDAYVVDKDDKHPQLRIIDIETRKVKQITEEKWRISEFTWTPDGKFLIISATDNPQPELFTDKIYLVHIEDGKMEKIISPKGPFNNLKVSPDGKFIAYLGSRVDGPGAYDLYLLSIKDKTPLNLTETTINRIVSSFEWYKDGSFLILSVTGFSRTFYTIARDGKVNRLGNFNLTPSGSFDVNSNFLVFVGETATQPPELWVSYSPGKAKKITDFNKEWDNIKLIRPEKVHYPSFDGKEIEAAVYKPFEYQQGKRFPLVVLVHGGPSGVWSNRFNSWAQLLSTRGFVVLCPNIRGSIGYGYEFMISNRRDWGGGDFKDVMAGVDYMIEQGIADPEKIGIGGWSYGGYMAAWAVTQTDRFKASVSGAPMTDLAVEYGTETNSINPYDTWYLGTPYENLKLFIERSPMTHIKNVRTPTLILCGKEDVIDPIAQCYQFHRGLKRYGVETELVVYPREGHGIREEKHQIDVLNRVINWFEKYLK